MFGRRVYASAAVPRRMWPALHIQSSSQALRILPSLAPLHPTITRHVALVSAPLTSLSAVGLCESSTELCKDTTQSQGCVVLSLISASWCQPHNFLPPFVAECTGVKKVLH
ncbi:hypothetical protein, conserved [Trypanosoma brucei gambiense DAL972]|uniref:Uncharacterized protein n=3 Tax=Trypanosoma brucei TaxID=5691 RepID=Q387S4_TRYB2|nr:hypothetical protein, conserved [Trypanosoma brucei gambiense DAL972]XP_828060.1 hypothetical protein, conserved [Trypanosoma brucei brucei TREU927]EAN78948.1 hypothetical protein, conserved [Trypanosoma brucei brucei TREU927]RHW69384.1 hypothetical protein DPX39_100166800 [Trypanosoma brucei equiperdum]CBH16841.1 hypothetical protein, conserved [Trypanosoma brucei gambiense DAL972]|eukprot:XP_011779105.1 hypothetical protein, conserved [Trypanosoma brucei gambiense DAL972]